MADPHGLASCFCVSIELSSLTLINTVLDFDLPFLTKL